MQMEIAMNRRQLCPRCYQHHRHSRHYQRCLHLLHYLRFVHACFVATYYRRPHHRLHHHHHRHHRRRLRQQPRHHRHLRHRRPRYQAFVIIHLKESTESGKASVQPRIDNLLKVEESTRTRQLKCKKELIATILDAVIFQRAGTRPYATALIVPPHQVQTLHSRLCY